MLALKKRIVLREDELRRHPIFEMVEASQSPMFLIHTARAIAWLPFVFQDVLRLTAEQIRGSEYERFVEYHRNEDSGHETWFLHDLRALGASLPSFEESFGAEFEGLRDACYALLSEVHRCESNAQRVAFLLALRGTARVFFEELSLAVTRVCPELPLRYFVRSHGGVEKNYSLFGESMDAELERTVLGDAERARCERTIERTEQLFIRIFSYLAGRTQNCRHPVSHVRQLPGPPVWSVREARGSQ